MKDFNSEDIENKIGYTFKNKDLLLKAFTHSSFSNENKAASYERLEFLGDSILGYVVAGELFQRFPDNDEGLLTTARAKLVSAQSLSKIIQSLDVMEYVRVGKGSIKETRISKKVQCDLFESIAGAILLDNNWEIKFCKDYILRFFNSKIDNIINTKDKDYKTVLKELCDKNRKTVSYDYAKEDGNTFTATVYINNKEYAKGNGKSKSEAAQHAADSFLKDNEKSHILK